jgi:ABC-type glycerol-3-phosphate transport system substrate-binding protein
MRMGLAIGAGLLVLALATSAGAASFDPELEAAARREGNVVWYTGLIVNQITRPMAAAFETRFPGVRVRYSRASNTETTLKLLNEARAHRVQADVFDVTSGIHTLLEARAAAAYQPAFAAHFPAVLKDPEGYWFGTNLYFLTVAYNTNLVERPYGLDLGTGGARPTWFHLQRPGDEGAGQGHGLPAALRGTAAGRHCQFTARRARSGGQW